MSRYGTLLRLNLRNRLAGLRPGSWRTPAGKLDGRRIATAAAVILCVAMAAGMVIGLELLLFRGLGQLGQPWLLPALTLLMAMLGMAVMSFFSVMARLYFSRDTAWMAYLPVKSGTVLSVKLTEIYLGEALLSACLLLPALVLCGNSQGMGLGYWLRCALTVLLTPMLPLALLTLLTTLLAAGTSVTRNREAWMMVGSLVMVAAVLVFEMNFVMRIPEDADAAYFLRLLMDREGLLRQLSAGFPPVRWAVAGLRGDGGQMALFALVSVGSLAAVQALLGGRYLPLALRQQERSGRRKAARLNEGTVRRSGAVTALYRRELRELLRTPAYAMNGLSGAVAFPLVMVIMVLSSGASEDMAAMGAGLSWLMAQAPAGDLLLVFAGIIGFAGMMNPAAATAVSREGGRFPFNRTLPVSGRTQLRAKLLMGETVGLLGTLIMAVALGALLRPNPWVLVGAFALAQLPTLATSAISLALDAAHPRLHFANETQAIKQNVNVMFSMLIGLLALALPAAAIALRGASPALRLGAALAVCLLEAAMTLPAMTHASRAYDHFEDHQA